VPRGGDHQVEGGGAAASSAAVFVDSGAAGWRRCKKLQCKFHSGFSTSSPPPLIKLKVHSFKEKTRRKLQGPGQTHTTHTPPQGAPRATQEDVGSINSDNETQRGDAQDLHRKRTITVGPPLNTAKAASTSQREETNLMAFQHAGTKPTNTVLPRPTPAHYHCRCRTSPTNIESHLIAHATQGQAPSKLTNTRSRFRVLLICLNSVVPRHIIFTLLLNIRSAFVELS
jgi:hypothetical protein